MTAINDLPRFTVTHQLQKLDSKSEMFKTFEEAEATFQAIEKDLLHDTQRLEDSHWWNNKAGLSCELKVLKIEWLPASVLLDLANAETEEELSRIWVDASVDYSETIKERHTYLSDEFDENLGEDGEFVIKINRLPN